MGTQLPAAALFNYPTVDELVDHLYALLSGEFQPGKPESGEQQEDTELEDLSEDELATMLAGKLVVTGGRSTRGL